jgi:hypothetical protein
MTDVVIGTVLLAIGATFVFVALPDKNLESPRFLRFHSATVIFPPLVLTFLVGGGAELLTGLSQIVH